MSISEDRMRFKMLVGYLILLLYEGLVTLDSYEQESVAFLVHSACIMKAVLELRR